MIFALGFIIAVGVCLCIPQVWSKVETFFNRRQLYTPDEVDVYEMPAEAEELIEGLKIMNQQLAKKYEAVKEYRDQILDNNQELVDNNQKLADQILQLKSQPPKETIKEVPVEVVKEVFIPAPAEDPRLEPAIDELLEHLKLRPDPGDMASWRENYLSAVHKIANIRAFDLQNENIDQKVAELSPEHLKYTPVI